MLDVLKTVPMQQYLIRLLLEKCPSAVTNKSRAMQGASLQLLKAIGGYLKHCIVKNIGREGFSIH
jgi:hypothetical protein